MSKQDRQGARTVEQLNRRYDVKQAMGVANNAQKAATVAHTTAYETQKGLSDKVDKTDDAQVVAMLNRAEDTIVKGENFSVTKDGTVIAKAGRIGDWNIGKPSDLAEYYDGTVLYSDTFLSESSEEITVYLTPEKLYVGRRTGLEVTLDYVPWADIVRKVNNLT